MSPHGQHAGSIYIGEQPSGDQFLQIIKWNMDILYKTSHTSFLQNNNSFCLLVSDKKFFLISANQTQELPMATLFFVQLGWYEKSHRIPSIYTACKISLYLVKRFQMRRFWEIDRVETRIADRDEISTLYRGSFIDASFSVSVYLAKQFQMRSFKCETLTGRRQMTDAMLLQDLTWSLTSWAKNDITHQQTHTLLRN
jgi:hypothetical protein